MPLIHAVVASLFPFKEKIMDIHKARYFGGRFPFKGWSLYSISGNDRVNFLQGQTTNDVKKLNERESHLNTRLTRQGRVLSYFYLGKVEDKIYLLIPEELADVTITDLNKFIIMDDVVITKVPLESSWVILSPKSKKILSHLDSKNSFLISLYGEEGLFIWNRELEKELDLPIIEKPILDSLKTLSGFPVWGENVKEENLLNDTFLNEMAISYSKGCFLGQETVSKIQNNRGSAKFPILIKIQNSEGKNISGLMGRDLRIDNKKIGQCFSFSEYQGALYLQASLLREYRIEGRKLQFSIEENNFEGSVLNLPFFKDHSSYLKSRELYKEAVSLFQKDEEEEAKNLLLEVIKVDPQFADAYESLGVIYGRHENYVSAIEFMDDLLRVDPESIMAHTNKSLFLMKMGKIEEAEKEKDFATVKSFKRAGQDSKNKKLEVERLKVKENELKKREGMFLQVLKLDEFDLIANFGMADICHSRSEYEKSLTFLNKVLDNNPKYSNAYLLLGKTYEGMNKKDKAKETYERGIPVASVNGDMMPANEMQRRLLTLK